jgi:hypothetical protein
LRSAGLLAVIACLAIAAASAYAASTRAEYVAQVDPICQAGQAQEDAIGGPVVKKLKRLQRREKRAHSRKARAAAQKREFRLLARFYDSVSVIEQNVNTQIAAIPPAVEDTSLVQVWLRARGEEVVLTQRLFRSVAKGDLFGAFGLLLEVQAKSEEAIDLVRDFGFQHCTSTSKQIGL